MQREVICHLFFGMSDRWEAVVKETQKGGERGTQQPRVDLKRVVEGR